MFTNEKPEITAAVEAAMNLANEMSRGEVIDYDSIAERCGIDRNHQSWGTFYKKWRTKLLNERSIATETIANVGIKLLTDEESVMRCAANRQKRIGRQAARGAREVASADSSKLPMQLQRLKLMQIDKLNETAKASKSARAEVRAMGQTESLPKRVC